jgi:hypothetical protein
MGTFAFSPKLSYLLRSCPAVSLTLPPAMLLRYSGISAPLRALHSAPSLSPPSGQ